MKIPDNRYLFITGVIRALDSKRVKKETIDKIMRSGLQTDMGDFFKDTPYSDYIRIHGLNGNFNSMLSWRRKSVFEFLEKYSADRNVVMLLKSGYDFHNIRVLLKNKIFEYHDTGSIVDSGSIDKQSIIELFRDEQYDSLPQIMNAAVIAAIEAYYLYKKPMMIDSCIDRYLYMNLLNICSKLNSAYTENYIRLSIDLMNFQIAFRSGAAFEKDSDMMNIFIDGGKVPIEEIVNISRETDKHVTGIKVAEKYGLIRLVKGINDFKNNIFSIERECDNALNDYLDKAAFFIWGPEPAIAYGYSVEIEIRILGLILNSIKNGLSVELIKKRLPELR